MDSVNLAQWGGIIVLAAIIVPLLIERFRSGPDVGAGIEERIEWWAQRYVRAAEEAARVRDMDGPDKFDYVLEELEDMFPAVEVRHLAAIAKSAVNELKRTRREQDAWIEQD